MLVLSCAAGCTGAESVRESPGSQSVRQPAGSATLDELRTAQSCPLKVDGSQLPPGLRLRPQGHVYSNATKDKASGLVQVVCEFPIAGGKPAETLTVSVAGLPTGSSADVFSVDSLANLTFNETGVDRAELQSTVQALEVDEVATLAGNGEFLAIRPVRVTGASNAVVLVYGPDGLAPDALKAAASATTW